MMIDINCDLGEGNNTIDCERDALLMPFISRCNIACGGHAGNQLTMKLTVDNAIKHKLAIGAHPSYPDVDNFGRISINIPIVELKESLLKQIDDLQNITTIHKVKLTHLKFHGALYNDIEADQSLADKIANFILEHFPTLSVICLAEGRLMESCLARNIHILQEAFIDRRYLANKKLSPRTMNDSVIEDENLAIEQAISFANNKPIKTIDANWISIKADTLCLHGDNNNSLEIAQGIHKALKVQQELKIL